MSAKRKSIITSYFNEKTSENSKSEAAIDESGSSAANNNPPDTSPEGHIASKGKRPNSSPPPALAVKRQNTKGEAYSERKQLAYSDLPSDWANNSSSSTAQDTASKLHLTYHTGDMFSNTPKNCLLIHACNTQGHWGAGIAKAFKDLHPKAFKVHHNFCTKEHSKANPVPTGTTQLLAPVDGDPQHWIGCVFTSAKYGKAKDKPEAIVRNTVQSMRMLLELVKLADQEEGCVSEIRMCKINSGKFGVPWEKTEEALESIMVQEGWRTTIQVWEP